MEDHENPEHSVDHEDRLHVGDLDENKDQKLESH